MTIYYFRVLAKGDDTTTADSDYSAAESVSLELVAPGVPGKPSLIGKAADTDVTITWAAPTSGGAPADYVVEWTAKGADDWTTDDVDVDFATRQATISGLTAETDYQFRVRAVNDAGVSSDSEIFEVKTDAALTDPPGMPVFLTVVGKADTIVVITWAAYTPGTPAPTSYVVEWTAKGEDDWSDEGVAVTFGTRTATITGLTAGTEYEFRVRAVNSIGESKDSAILDVTTTLLPEATILTAVSPASSLSLSGDNFVTTLTFMAPERGTTKIYRIVGSEGENGNPTLPTAGPDTLPDYADIEEAVAALKAALEAGADLPAGWEEVPIVKEGGVHSIQVEMDTRWVTQSEAPTGVGDTVRPYHFVCMTTTDDEVFESNSVKVVTRVIYDQDSYDNSSSIEVTRNIWGAVVFSWSSWKSAIVSRGVGDTVIIQYKNGDVWTNVDSADIVWRGYGGPFAWNYGAEVTVERDVTEFRLIFQGSGYLYDETSISYDWNAVTVTAPAAELDPTNTVGLQFMAFLFTPVPGKTVDYYQFQYQLARTGSFDPVTNPYATEYAKAGETWTGGLGGTIGAVTVLDGTVGIVDITDLQPGTAYIFQAQVVYTDGTLGEERTSLYGEYRKSTQIGTPKLAAESVSTTPDSATFTVDFDVNEFAYNPGVSPDPAAHGLPAAEFAPKVQVKQGGAWVEVPSTSVSFTDVSVLGATAGTSQAKLQITVSDLEPEQTYEFRVSVSDTYEGENFYGSPDTYSYLRESFRSSVISVTTEEA